MCVCVVLRPRSRVPVIADRPCLLASLLALPQIHTYPTLQGARPQNPERSIHPSPRMQVFAPPFQGPRSRVEMAEMDLCHNSHPDQKLTNHPTFGTRRCDFGETQGRQPGPTPCPEGKAAAEKALKAYQYWPRKVNWWRETDVTRKSPIGLDQGAIREVSEESRQGKVRAKVEERKGRRNHVYHCRP